MPVKNIVPMLATGDMEETIAFYRDLLGFEVRDKFESGGETWWCELVRDGQALMFTQHEVDVDAPGARAGFGQTSINLYVDEGVEEFHEHLKGLGVAVSELHVAFYGVKQFDLRDPAGYTLIVGQPTDEAPTVVDPGAPPF